MGSSMSYLYPLCYRSTLSSTQSYRVMVTKMSLHIVKCHWGQQYQVESLCLRVMHIVSICGMETQRSNTEDFTVKEDVLFGSIRKEMVCSPVNHLGQA